MWWIFEVPEGKKSLMKKQKHREVSNKLAKNPKFHSPAMNIQLDVMISL